MRSGWGGVSRGAFLGVEEGRVDLSAGSGRKHLSSGLGEAGFISATALFISVTSPSLLFTAGS